MQAVHELGHVIAALAAGERVDGVHLHPLGLSRTDVTHDRHPLWTIWGGPAFGVASPLAFLALARTIGWRLVYLARFFAGFCLVANGVYLGVGVLDGAGDAGDLVRYGSPAWSPAAFGVVCTPVGLRLWHGLGPTFGLGEARGEVDRRAVRWAIGLALALAAAGVALEGR